MKPTRQMLHDLWFEAAPPARLAVLRILVGLFALWYTGTGQDDLVKVVRTDPKLFAPIGIVFGEQRVKYGFLDGVELFRRGDQFVLGAQIKRLLFRR